MYFCNSTDLKVSFSSEIINWYRSHKRDLPWRTTRDPYKIWLSEVMLQQTQVNQGLPYYEKFTTHFPTVFDLANASEEKVLKLWQGLGYYSRAKNLHFTAKYIAKELNGVFPNMYSELIKLKGVGDYTASAIASICFNKPNAVVDGNVYRVLARYFGVDLPINSTTGQKYFKELAQSLIQTSDSGEYNQAIMEFGARQCKPQSPNCGICPLNSSCVALKESSINGLPVKLKKVKVSKRYFNYLVFLDAEQRTLYEQRTQKGIWQGLFQFPLLESKAIVAEKEVMNFLSDNYNFNIRSLSVFNEELIIHKLSHQHIHTKFWIVEINDQLKKALTFDEVKKKPTSVLVANFLNDFRF